MSYEFQMQFTKAESKFEAYTFLHTLSSALTTTNNAHTNLNNLLPYAISRFDYFGRKFDPCDSVCRLWLQEWIRGAFEVRSVYWPEHRLLGILGGNYGHVMDMSSPVMFQNGTDQDYSLEYWPKLDVFQDIIAQVRTIPDAEVLRELWGEDAAELSDDVEYARRSLIYDRVFDALDLDNWLYGRNGRFERMCMSGIETREKEHEIYESAIVLSKKIRG